MTDMTEELGRLAIAVSRLAPDRRNPEEYHEAKSDIVARLRSLAKQVGAEDCRGRAGFILHNLQDG